MKAILCVFGNRSHQCFNRWHRWHCRHIDLTGGLRGLLKGVAHLWKNKDVAPLRELLYIWYTKLPSSLKRARGFDASLIIKQQTSDQDHVNLSSCSLVGLELASLFNTPKQEPSDGTTPSMTKDMKNSKSCSVSYGCGLYPC